jgi:oxygen-dependent protoporphyrinogen oxidase
MAGNGNKIRIAVVGAGISGLSAAYRVLSMSKAAAVETDLRVFEGADSVGGVLKTELVNNRIVEHGPDSWVASKPDVMELVEDLGLTDQVISTNETNRRSLIAFDGELHPLPDGFVMLAPSRLIPFALSPLFSLSGKFRMALDMVTPPKTDDSDESVETFVLRRFGREALDKIVQPMVGGIYVGDVAKLSARSTLTQFVEMEQRQGSVIKGLMARKDNAHERTASGARYSMFVTLKNGVSTLSRALEAAIGLDRIEKNSTVTSVRKLDSGRWSVEAAGGSSEFDAVIMATPAFVTAQIVSNANANLASDLEKIETSSAAVINLLYKRADIPRGLNGFGFVVPVTEKRTILAASFISNKFKGRAPEDCVAVRAFVGGVLQPEHLKLSDADLVKLARADLEYYLGVKAEPLSQLVNRYPASMPQYNLGHAERVQKIIREVNQMPGVFLAGSSYNGVGIPDCITSGTRAALAAVEYARSILKLESVAT